ncbi:hypothetical protein DAPPUDRAFT_321033 [Daphnia pulex]|uniref:Uncharacterized protein n=1 Tax=Daphnia pulex TaxID=6669 RepID=E9GRQ7_DAPPU|nr:hypothetical protein DAPPUDRAFT_321033 [Daphnia pulex]|eukprot:EFX77813.1 hypothetical protein DAPPUDRAFT_321033 [Daphnia pulex]
MAAAQSVTGVTPAERQVRDIPHSLPWEHPIEGPGLNKREEDLMLIADAVDQRPHNHRRISIGKNLMESCGTAKETPIIGPGWGGRRVQLMLMYTSVQREPGVQPNQQGGPHMQHQQGGPQIRIQQAGPPFPFQHNAVNAVNAVSVNSVVVNSISVNNELPKNGVVVNNGVVNKFG